MPQQFWTHQCPGEAEHLRGSPRACECGGPMVYAGWRNTTHEAMAWSQKTSGLKLMGKHRRLEDRLFTGASTECGTCAGAGYFDAVGGLSFVLCGECAGAGYVSTISAEQRAALRSQVLKKFPLAAAPMDLPNPAFARLYHDIGQSVIIAVPVTLHG